MNTKFKNAEPDHPNYCEHCGYHKDLHAEDKTCLHPLIGSEVPLPVPASPLNVQVGGGHYKDLPIQPVEYIHANALGYFEGNVIKYVSRWRKKNGVADLEKAKHYIDLLIELEARK